MNYIISVLTTFIVLTAATTGCTSREGGTSKSGPSGQTVDSNFHVHRDKDGSVTGEPGVSPYAGRNDQKADPSRE